MLKTFSNIKISTSKRLENAIKHSRPILGQIERKRSQRYEMKCDTSETTSYKRSKFEMEDKSKFNIPYSSTKNDCHETYTKKYQPSTYNSSKFHDYSKEFPPLPASSSRNLPILIDITEDSEETKDYQKSKHYPADHAGTSKLMSHEHGKSSKSKSKSFQRIWRNTQLGDQLNGGHSRRHTPFTVMSYNVLSDDLMKRHKELYNQTSDLLDWENRWKRILKEIEKHSPDILCFQEVQCDHYETHFIPDLGARDFIGLYKKRTGDKDDGCAVFFNKNKFILEDFAQVEYHQPYAKSLNRDNIALITKFRPIQSGRVKSMSNEVEYNSGTFIVATTHLLYNPKREDVRLAQIALLFAELDRFAYKSDKDLHRCPPRSTQEYYYPCILTGDFNTNPNSPIYSFINDGQIEYRRSSIVKSSSLLPISLGITDNCQHLSVLLSRCKSFGTLHNIDSSKLIQTCNGRTEVIFSHDWLRVHWRARVEEAKNESTSESDVPGSISEMNNSSEPTYEARQIHQDHAHLFNSGSLYHAFATRSVYRNRKNEAEVTTKQQNGWVVVDYMLYSTSYSEKYNKFVEGNLKLVSKLELLSGQQCREMGGLPSNACPSDHLSLVAKFLLCN